MKRMSLLAIGLLLVGQAASAASSWTVFSFATTPQNAPKVVAAADALMNSMVGKEFPGRLHLQVQTINGANPATHSFVPLYKSAAEREAFVQKLQADPAWTTFTNAMTELTQPVAQVLNRTAKSWGTVSETDKVWMNHAFQVSDPAAFLASINTLMASETGKKFPGQVHLSGVVAGGLSPVTHVISVGYESEAEMDAWLDVRNASADWTAYIEASRKVADYLGGSLARDVKTWGPTTLKDLAMP